MLHYNVKVEAVRFASVLERFTSAYTLPQYGVIM